MSDLVECVTCRRFNLRDSPLAKHGFGLCALRPRHEMHSAILPLECRHHQPAPAATVDARRAWLDKALSLKDAP